MKVYSSLIHIGIQNYSKKNTNPTNTPLAWREQTSSTLPLPRQKSVENEMPARRCEEATSCHMTFGWSERGQVDRGYLFSSG